MFTSSIKYNEKAECVNSLFEKCIYYFKSNGYPTTDTRSAVFNNIKFTAYATFGNTYLIHSWTIKENSEIIPPLLGMKKKVTLEDITLMADSLEHSSKLALILIGQFQIENCIENVNNALGLSTGSSGFFKKAKTILDHVGMGNDKIQVLNTGALIRNSLHSNGIHRGFRNSDFHSIIEGVNYDFIHDIKVTCASLPHIAHLLESSVNILNDIINSPQVKSHSNLIEDKYVATQFD